MNEKSVKKFHFNRLKDGRGQGRGQEYKPFIQANDNKVASEGWLTRTLGWKSNRIHHTLSKHEYEYLLIQEWADSIVDIREQYPLLPIDLTLQIAEKLNIRHPQHNGENVVMSSDFMLTYVNTQGDYSDVPRTIKPISKLTKRTLELFEIERRYYQEMGQEWHWKVVFDIHKPINLIKNIDWLYDAKRIDNRPGIDSEVVGVVRDPLLSLLTGYGSKHSISKTCLLCDIQLGLEKGSSLFIVQHMLANKIWITDMNELIRESKPLIINRNEEQQQANKLA
ncbi:TnsA endonuclease N-terminal domain-containing protein [Paenibacillus melissococcoides]|uniref:TnsA endonuclease N-terminal domain-containing protein n=1 Tax=Paenibacillus melissococcoides TaxID=2912268 RepID=A0ABM9GC00_9BACL|nr:MULTISPECIES: TnsA endonuclease N-terminal domain-containing protein [Paenibacillus]MEB9897285.1 TnsA endonuclease N-terminal domain-containing protein [Bacillus cereus]GIO78979.1 hypothetical protein J6TS7_25890 [Paenibacillus dendritiformis]CAH8249508.1 TnsA endonuclease N-terminal domain-containing protein [Paenibacillus melissococcoides]CAH8721171.1 TnsA endonuclease N-terminal domain-containing protein [Paenibacillus melissococcoides]